MCHQGYGRFLVDYDNGNVEEDSCHSVPLLGADSNRRNACMKQTEGSNKAAIQ